MNAGFVYVATGPAYVAEAVASACSLREQIPDAAIALVTDAVPSPAATHVFNHVIIRPGALRQPIDKLLCWDAPFERCVFLDTDTLIGGDISDMFQILDGFDLAAAPETLRGWHYQLPGIPASFPEFNTGVIAFRRNDRTARFFAEWKRQFEVLSDREGFVSDQPAFRSAAFFSEARLAPLPSEYHFIAGTPNYTMWRVLLLHGRGDLRGILASLNARLGPRVFLPRWGIVQGFAGRKTWLQQGLRLLWTGLRLLVTRRADTSRLLNTSWISREAAQRAELQSGAPPSPRP